MKKLLVLSLVLGFVLSLGVSQVQASDAAALLDSASCTMCHNGDGAKVIVGGYKGIAAEKVKSAIVDGVDGMPGAADMEAMMGVSLNDDEIKQISTYVAEQNK